MGRSLIGAPQNIDWASALLLLPVLQIAPVPDMAMVRVNTPT
ncbi:MAG: hypothetical protein AAGH41_13420 [Pseudomonadota bacterium]